MTVFYWFILVIGLILMAVGFKNQFSKNAPTSDSIAGKLNLAFTIVGGVLLTFSLLYILFNI